MGCDDNFPCSVLRCEKELHRGDVHEDKDGNKFVYPPRYEPRHAKVTVPDGSILLKIKERK